MHLAPRGEHGAQAGVGGVDGRDINRDRLADLVKQVRGNAFGAGLAALATPDVKKMQQWCRLRGRNIRVSRPVECGIKSCARGAAFRVTGQHKMPQRPIGVSGCIDIMLDVPSEIEERVGIAPLLNAVLQEVPQQAIRRRIGTQTVLIGDQIDISARRCEVEFQHIHQGFGGRGLAEQQRIMGGDIGQIHQWMRRS